MTTSDLQAIERLLSDFAWYADRGDGEQLGGLFTPDAELHVGGQVHKGRDAIAKDCYQRAADATRTVRHMWSNLRVQGIAEDRLNTVAIQLTFEQTGATPRTELRVNDLLDQFVQDPTNGSWRFARRVIARAITLPM